MKVEKKDGTSTLYNTEDVGKISFYEVGTNVNINYNITVVDANYKPFPAFSVQIWAQPSSNMITNNYDNGACYQTFMDYNPSRGGYTNAQGLVTFTIIYPVCVAQTAPLVDLYFISLKLSYNGTEIGLGNNVTFINGNGSSVNPQTDTQFTIVLKNTVLP